MKKLLTLLFAAITWYAVIEQYILMMENRMLPVAETTIRFFSYFTILTNLIVAVYLTYVFFARKGRLKIVEKPGTLTAITVYITLVGLTYQVLLRNTWNPQGLQRVVDELLHSVVPVLVIIYWSCYEKTRRVRNVAMFTWAIYPLGYFIFIILRGASSHFYPYPFVDVTTLGMSSVLINAAGIVLLFAVIAALFIFIGQKVINR